VRSTAPEPLSARDGVRKRLGATYADAEVTGQVARLAEMSRVRMETESIVIHRGIRAQGQSRGTIGEHQPPAFHRTQRSREHALGIPSRGGADTRRFLPRYMVRRA